MSTDEPRRSPALDDIEPSPTTIDHDEDGDDRHAAPTPRRSGLADPLGGATPHPGAAGSELVRGDVVGRHLVLARLGHGGMGVVYAAHDPELDRRVALKLLIGRRHDDPVARTRLLREAQAMARLSHPNVVAVHDVGTVRGQVYLAMELVEGQTLRAWLEAAPRGWREVLVAFAAAGEGLHAAHVAGLVHRDFKPENVMIGDDGRVRVMDFGLARGSAAEDPVELDLAPARVVGDALASPLTRTGAQVGTPRYMAPEQWSGEPATARTDQFAFCVALWEALHREAPFAGRDVADLRRNVTEGRLRTPEAGRDVPRWLRRLVRRGLERDPAARWPAMRELLVALERGRARERRRGVTLAVGGLGVALAAAGGWESWDRMQRIDGCADAGAEIVATWNDEAKASLHAALVGTQATGAEAAFERMVPWVDRFAAEWSEVSTAVCMEAEVERTRDAELHERSLACLQEQHGELATLLEALGRGEAKAVRQAVPAAAELPHARACVDPLSLARRPALPAEPELRAQVRAQQHALSQARGLHALGLYGAAVEAAQAVLAAAEPLGYAPLVVRARETLGAVAMVDGKLELAHEQLVRAFVDAGSHGDDEVAARAAVSLVLLEGSERANAAEGRLWARTAEVFVERAGQAQASEGIRLLRAMAALHFHAGELEQAREVGTRAAALAREVLGPEHPTSGLALVSLASATAELGRTAEAEQQFSQAVEILSAALGPEHPAVATPLSNLAAVLMLEGRWDEARTLHERTLAICESAYGPRSRRVGITLANLAALELELGRYAEALALQRRSLAALEASRGPEHPEVGAALINLADILLELGSPDEARKELERAQRIVETALGPAHASLALPLARLGELDARQGELERARALYERALAIVETAAGTDNPDYGGLMVSLGELELQRGELDAAEGSLRRAAPIFAKTPGNPDAVRLQLAQGALALARGDATVAAASYEQALARLADGQSRPDRRGHARFGLARALATTGPTASAADPARARSLAEQALADYRAAGAAHAERVREVETWLRSAGA